MEDGRVHSLNHISNLATNAYHCGYHGVSLVPLLLPQPLVALEVEMPQEGTKARWSTALSRLVQGQVNSSVHPTFPHSPGACTCNSTSSPFS